MKMSGLGVLFAFFLFAWAGIAFFAAGLIGVTYLCNTGLLKGCATILQEDIGSQ